MMNLGIVILFIVLLNDLSKAEAFTNRYARHSSYSVSRPCQVNLLDCMPSDHLGDLTPDEQKGTGSNDDSEPDVIADWWLDPFNELEKFLEENDLKRFFRILNLKAPPLRFYETMIDPAGELQSFIDKHGGRMNENCTRPYYDIDYGDRDQAFREQAYQLYVAAHSREDDPEVDLLTDSEWKELFHSILHDRKSQELLEDVMTVKKFEPFGVYPNHNQGEKVWKKWRRRVWIDKSIIGIIQRPLRRFRERASRPPVNDWRLIDNWKPSITCATADRFEPRIRLGWPWSSSFMPAVILFLAYNEKFYSPPGASWKTIPMDQILDHAYDQRMIYNRIVNDKGYSSYDYLRKFTVKQQDEILIDWRDTCLVDFVRENGADLIGNCLVDLVRQNGAGLISDFRVGRDFLDPNKFTYDGKPVFRRGDLARTHAMVLAGARLDREGKCWILVHNAWTSKQIVEMSLDYFCECSPALHFANHKLELKEVFKPTEVPQRYHESYIHDGFNDGGDGRMTLQIVDGKA